MLFFFTSETKVGCVEKLRHLHLFPGFLYSPRSHMINVLENYLWSSTRNSNTAYGATTRSPPQWTRALPQRLEKCCHAIKTFGRMSIL